MLHSYCFQSNGTKLQAWINQYKHFIVGKKLLGCYRLPSTDTVYVSDDRILFQFENCCILINFFVESWIEFSVYMPTEYSSIENRMRLQDGTEFYNISFLGMYGGITTDVTVQLSNSQYTLIGEEPSSVHTFYGDYFKTIQIYQEGLPPIHIIGGHCDGIFGMHIYQKITTFDLLKQELSLDHISVPRILNLLFSNMISRNNLIRFWHNESFEKYSSIACDMRARAESKFPELKATIPFVDLWSSPNPDLDIALEMFRTLLILIPSRLLKEDREKRAIASIDECWKMADEIYSGDNPFYSNEDNYDTAEVYYTLANIMKTITLPMSIRILHRLETVERILNQRRDCIFSDELNPTLWELFQEIDKCANDIQSLHHTGSKTKLINKVLHELEFGIIIAEENIDQLAKAPEEIYYSHYRTILQALTAYSQHFQKLKNMNLDTGANSNQLKMLILFINILEEKITHTTLSAYKEDLYNSYCQLIDIYEAAANYKQAEEIRQRMYATIRRSKPYS